MEQPEVNVEVTTPEDNSKETTEQQTEELTQTVEGTTEAQTEDLMEHQEQQTEEVVQEIQTLKSGVQNFSPESEQIDKMIQLVKLNQQTMDGLTKLVQTDSETMRASSEKLLEVLTEVQDTLSLWHPMLGQLDEAIQKLGAATAALIKLHTEQTTQAE